MNSSYIQDCKIPCSLICMTSIFTVIVAQTNSSGFDECPT